MIEEEKWSRRSNDHLTVQIWIPWTVTQGFLKSSSKAKYSLWNASWTWGDMGQFAMGLINKAVAI